MSFIRCRTCVMPNTRPDTPFVNGECAACISYRKRAKVDWDARKAELLKLLDKHGGRCIVPSSGGKDSTWQALTLKSLGADVTAVTARTCHLTPIGRANIDNLARHVRTIEVVPNMTVRAKLNRLGMELVGDLSHPEHMAIFSTPFRVACDIRVPLIFFGECPQAIWGGPVGTDEAQTMTRRWVSEFGGLLGLRPSDFVGMDGITERDMADYGLPDDGLLAERGVTAYFLGQFIPWDSRGNAEFAQKVGMRSVVPCPANWLRGENLDSAITGLRDHTMYRKFGFGRGCQQISAEVRAGRVERDWALEWVREHDGLFPRVYAGVTLAEAMDRLGWDNHRDFMPLLQCFTDRDLFAGEVDDRPILREFA